MSIETELIEYRKIFENELHNDILPYWMNYSVEKEGNGFYGAVNLKNEPILAANKSCVLNARILWTFSAAAKIYPGREYEEMAHRAYRVVMEDFADKEKGGFFMELNASNEVVNDTKHSYVQAFVLYALSKYYEFFSDEQVMQDIRSLFFFLDKKMKDPDNKGYLESFNRDWEKNDENQMTNNNEPKSMNTHLHLLEAYTAVYKIWKGDLIKQRLTELINIFIYDIIREDGHLGIFFSADFLETEATRGICSFGHEFEASWLIWEATEILEDPNLMVQMKPLVVKMGDAVFHTGVDKNGGFFLESGRFGSHVRTNKHWWIQAEGLVGAMNMFQLKEELKYWETIKLSWHFIDRYVIDHEKGEWFAKVNRLGVPYLVEPPGDPSPFYKNDRKIDPWKCPYHNSRAMMEMVQRINNLLERWKSNRVRKFLQINNL